LITLYEAIKNYSTDKITGMMKIILSFTFLLFSQFMIAQPNSKNRAIILTDIEADPDDTQLLVRLFLYSN
jgi:uncharacterized membrane protein